MKDGTLWGKALLFWIFCYYVSESNSNWLTALKHTQRFRRTHIFYFIDSNYVTHQGKTTLHVVEPTEVNSCELTSILSGLKADQLSLIWILNILRHWAKHKHAYLTFIVECLPGTPDLMGETETPIVHLCHLYHQIKSLSNVFLSVNIHLSLYPNL